MEKLKRSANWGEGERAYAVKLIIDKSDVLGGKFRGASQGAKLKDTVWQDIANDLNASGQASCIRSVNELKKMYGNMKSRAKDKHFSNSKTGGGATSTFTPTEDIIISHLLANNRSQLKGLESGIDSIASQPEPDVSTYATVQEIYVGNNLIDSNNNTVLDIEEVTAVVGCSGDGKVPQIETEGKGHFQHKKTAKRIREDKEDDLYDLERKKINTEIELIEQKKIQNKELFLLKKKLLEKQLDA